MNRILILTSILLVSATAEAQPFYVGAHIGESIIDDSPTQVIGQLDTDETWRIHAGWQFHENWALEGSYHDFGTASGQFSPCPEVCIPDIPVSREFSSDAWSLRMAWHLGDQRWQPFAAVGWTWAGVDGRVRGIGSGVGVGYSDDDDGFSAELGLRMTINEQFALRAGYEWFDLALVDAGAFNIGAEWRF